MARAKIKCSSTKLDGTPCKNWASEGSLYCHFHQRKETSQDRIQIKNAESNASLMTIVIIAILFIMSLSLGCEREFIKWMGN